MTSVTVGDVEIVALFDLEFGLPYASFFPGVSEEQWAPYREQYPRTTRDEIFTLSVQCYAVRSSGRTLLIDTGFGPGPFERLGGVTGKLLPNMQAKGVDPDDVDTVIFTHLHLDHVGWSVRDGRPLFAKARYLAPEADWEAFTADDQAAQNPHIAAQIQPLHTLGLLDLVSGEQEITPELSLLPTPGHTPGHQSIVISSGGERAFILGDVSHHPAQLQETDWNAGADMDGPKAAATRKTIAERLEADGSLVAACHYPEPGLGHIVRVGGKRVFRAL